jgi:hypothetical protein
MVLLVHFLNMIERRSRLPRCQRLRFFVACLAGNCLEKAAGQCVNTQGGVLG